MTDLTTAVDGIVHEPTQIREDGGLDLTLSAVRRVSEPGRVDFGGSELAAAKLSTVDTHRRQPDDDYEWWELPAGTYLIAFNEELGGDVRVRIEPRTAVLERGASHPSVTRRSLPLLPFSVSGAGLRLKENCRISTATLLED